MKPHLSTTTSQNLVLTPQLRQAIHLLQLSTAELEAEVAEAVASNPLLDWVEEGDHGSDMADSSTPAPTEGASMRRSTRMAATSSGCTMKGSPETRRWSPWAAAAKSMARLT